MFASAASIRTWAARRMRSRPTGCDVILMEKAEQRSPSRIGLSKNTSACHLALELVDGPDTQARQPCRSADSMALLQLAAGMFNLVWLGSRPAQALAHLTGP